MTDLELLGLVELIYEAAINPARWYAALDAVRAQLGFFNATLTLVELPSARLLVGVQVNVPEPFAAMQSDPKYVPAQMELWGGMAAINKHVVEQPVVISRIADPDDYAGNLYYLDFAKPQDLVDVVVLPLLRSRSMIGDIGMGRHRSEGLVSDGVIRDLGRIAPHIRRAASVSGILSIGAEMIDTFAAAIDATPAGVILVDDKLAIVHANLAAAEMLHADDPLTTMDGRLALRREIVRGALEEAVRAAAEAPLAMGRKGISIPGRRIDGSPVGIHVLPLLRRDGRGAGTGVAVAAIFVAESVDAQPKADVLGALFELTPSEARVLELASAGMSNPGIAEELGVALSTVKTHVLHIFEKTGRHTKAELIRLVHDLTLPN